jgi:hypothetical protein
MSEYTIIVSSTDPNDAKAKLLAWLEKNKAVREKLGAGGSDDLIMDYIRGDGGKAKYQYRIRQALLEEIK